MDKVKTEISDTAAVPETQSSRITHTWVKDGDRWKLLGGDEPRATRL